MVNLPSIRPAPATTQAPQSRVSAGEIRQLGMATADVLDGAKTMVEDIATPYVEDQARRDALADSHITRNENGELSVEPRPTPFLAGKLADVYRQTHAVAFQADLRNSTNTALQDLAAKTWLPVEQGGGGGNPEWFREQSGAYVKGVAEKQRGGMQSLARQEGDAIAGEYFRNISQKRQAIDAKNAATSIDGRMAQLEEDLSSLAFNGAGDSDEARTKHAELDGLRATKAGDPRMGYTPDQALRDKQQADRDLQAQAIVGGARRDYQTDWNLQRVQQDAEKKLGGLSLPPKDVLKYMGEINSHLKSTDAAIRQERADLAAEADSFREVMKTSGKIDDKRTNELVDRLKGARLYSKAFELEAARDTAALGPIVRSGTVKEATDAISGLGSGSRGIVGTVTAYGPVSAPDGSSHARMEGGPLDARDQPIVMLHDYDGSKPLTLAGAKEFAGRRYTIPEITYTGPDGQQHTKRNVEAVVTDTGDAFKGAAEGRFDIPVAKDMTKAQLAAQPFSKQGIQFIPRGDVAPVPPRGTKMTAETWSLKFYKPEDMLAPTAGGKTVDARAATMADTLGQRFFDETGIRVGINNTAPWKPGDSTEGYRRGSSDPADNPHVADSQHLHGGAFDFQIQGLTDAQKGRFLSIARQVGFTGVGFYEGKSGHLHLDTGSERSWGSAPAWASAGMAIRPPAAGAAGNPSRVNGDYLRQTPPADANVQTYRPNPFFRSTVAALQKDYDERAKVLWGNMATAWESGKQPSQAELDDLATMFPHVSDEDLKRKIDERLKIEETKEGVAGLSLTQLSDVVRESQDRAARGEASPLERKVADDLADQEKRRSAMLTKNPADYSQTHLDPKATGQQLSPLNYADAGAFGAGLAARQKAVDTVRQVEPTAGANPLRQGEAANLGKVLTNAPGKDATAYVQQLATTLKPEQLTAALEADDKALAVAVKGMTMSGDPEKMAAGFSLMDRVDRDNPDKMAAVFGDDSQKRLDTWNAKTSFLPVDQVVKDMLRRDDPATKAAKDALEKEATKKANAYSAGNVAGFFKPHWYTRESSILPESMTPALEQGRLRQDFNRQFAAYYAEIGDEGQAATLAAKRVGQVWGLSDASSGRLMRYPPETRVKPINGSTAWVSEQLQKDIAPALEEMGTSFKPEPFYGIGMPGDTSGLNPPQLVLVADDKTKADIGGGLAPSYQVIAIRNGEHILVTAKDGTPQRWRPDQEAALKAATDADQAKRSRRQSREDRLKADAEANARNLGFDQTQVKGLK